MIAVIQTGGKQYIVKEQDVIKVEKLPGGAGETIKFNNVLLVGDPEGTSVSLGRPVVSGAEVLGRILEQGKAKKISVIKFKSKVRYKRNVGHRQPFTKVKIEKIVK